MIQLWQLAQPFPDKYIETNPSGGGSYVKHHIVTQRLLMDLGPFDWELREVIRGYVPATPPDPNANSARGKAGTPALDNAIVGVIGVLSVRIDGKGVSVEEAGDCEQPHNWPHDGARLKDASSDALKRCAMRLGLGLHLWSAKPGEYFLANVLAKREAERTIELVGGKERQYAIKEYPIAATTVVIPSHPDEGDYLDDGDD